MSNGSTNKKRRWKRGDRVYRYDSPKAQGLIFSAPNFYMWAWGVWGHQITVEGIESSLRSAKVKANAALDRIEATQ
jgi:hypothetical protein